MERKRSKERAKGEREEEEGWGSREQQEGRVMGQGQYTMVLAKHTPGGGWPRAGVPTIPGGERGVNGLEVPDHGGPCPSLGQGTLLLPLGFQTLQRCREPNGVWDKAAPHS